MPSKESDPIKFASHYAIDLGKHMAAIEPSMTIAEAMALLEGLIKHYPKVVDWQKGIKDSTNNEHSTNLF